MADRDRVNEDTRLKFLGPPGTKSYCGLCGNSGVIDTRAFCICPNGRIIKHQLGGVLPPEGKPS